MRNLQNLKHTRLKFGDDAPAKLTATAWDVSDDSLILAFGPSQNDPVISIKRLSFEAKELKDAVAIASWEAPSPNPALAFDEIISIQCVPETKALVLALRGGDLITVRGDLQPGESNIEIVGTIDAGIAAASWSPDGDLLAVATMAGTLLFMSNDLEVVTSITLDPEDIKVSNHVNVGWGKRETQFQGRGVAKVLRDPTVPEHVDEGIPSSFDDGCSTISWRGDGQYVCLNSSLARGSTSRLLRVYSREGVLESVGETVDGIESALSWKPSGQLIAGVQRKGHDPHVIFFEKNGLRHGEFSLRLAEHDACADIKLEWNADSTFLAVSLEDRVQLWTVDNYHYHLKHEIQLDRADGLAVACKWHPEKSLDLLCSTSTEARVLSYDFDFCRGPVEPPFDLGLVVVIDGRQLRLTPLRVANIPPPMAFDEVELPDNALDVAINHSGTEAAVLHHDAVSIWSFDYTFGSVRMATLNNHIRIKTTEALDAGESNRLPCSIHVHGDCDRVGYLEDSFVRSTAYQRVEPSKISDGNSFDQGRPGVDTQFSRSGVLKIERGSQILRISGCTSHVLTRSHVIYTTAQHLLKFVSLDDDELTAPIEPSGASEYCRAVERGARIVTVMPSAYSVVLQMPRGNLETIYPRALVLAGIRRAVSDRDYKSAFGICRTHRVDLNILYDYAPEQFMQSAGEFIEQVQRRDYIDLFLSSLSEEDVTQTIYHEALPAGKKRPVDGQPHRKLGVLAEQATSKVNAICEALIHVVQGTPSRLLNLVTLHVCKNPPDLESGLRHISALRKADQDQQLDQAIEHICFLADANRLYEAALGIYDLDVALLIAQQSQKDPKEYVPYLQSLSDMPKLRRQFTIDDDLKRHERALGHLHAMNSFDEVQGYVAKHGLYSAAIKWYRYDDVRLKTLVRMHADYLNEASQFKQAGIAYESIADYASAHEAYRAIGMWRECISTATLASFKTDEVKNLAQDLADSLVEAKDFASAAAIHLDYLDDLEGATKLLCKSHSFPEAMRLAVSRQRKDLLSTTIDAGLVEASASMTDLLAEMKCQLDAQVPRLRELRRKKADDPMAFLDGPEETHGDVPDNISLAPTDASTSGGTFMTRYTNRSVGSLATNVTHKTSKNRRREERKRARGKKGTVYEEEYIVNSINRLIERLNSVVEDVRKLVEGLLRRGMRERSYAVQEVMVDVVDACQACMDEVFPAQTSKREQCETNGGEEKRPNGGEGVLWEALSMTKTERPILKDYDRLVLLS